MTFEKNVFVNCPFDANYAPLLRPLLFTLMYLDLNPRIALEINESSDVRIDKIMNMIRDSKYAIHDLSRTKAVKRGENYRLNMSFELGIDLACRKFGTPPLNQKRYLIIAKEKWAYREALSDISGSDISPHEDKPVQLIKVVRNWVANLDQVDHPGPKQIWNSFNDCMASITSELADDFFDEGVEGLPIPELLQYFKKWFRNLSIAAKVRAQGIPIEVWEKAKRA
jgi:hypothetical protein